MVYFLLVETVVESETSVSLINAHLNNTDSATSHERMNKQTSIARSTGTFTSKVTFRSGIPSILQCALFVNISIRALRGHDEYELI